MAADPAAVGLERAHGAFDDRVGGLEVARVREQADSDLAARRLAAAFGAEVVLDVAAATFGIEDDCFVETLALELPQDALVRHADGVGEHIEPAAVGHAEDDVLGAGRSGDVDRLVEHRHHHVEAFERELFLPEECPAEVLLEAFGVRQAGEQAELFVRGQRLAVAARLDGEAQPDALLVLGEVLDLEGHRSAVGLLKVRQSLGERLAGNVDAEQRRGDARLQLRRERRLETVRLERRVAHRLGAERVEARGEMAVGAVGLDERHRGCDAAEQEVVGSGRRGRRAGSGRRAGCGGDTVDEPRKARDAGGDGGVAALEQCTPFRRDVARIVEVFLEEHAGIASVAGVDFGVAHVESGGTTRWSAA